MITRALKNENMQAWLFLAFAFSFMVCIFSPIDVYYANADEFWFSLGQMLSVCLIVFFLVFVLLALFFFIIGRLKFSQGIMAFFLMLFVYFYIQGNYIPRNYGVMNGTEIEWNRFTGYAAASIITACVCMVVFLVILRRIKDKVVLLVKGVVLFVILIQVVTITTLIIRNGITPARGTRVTTTKDILDFSSDKNIIVVLLDTYDGDDLNYLLENDYQNQADIFENFTYYKDSLGAYPTTKCALPHILTGRWYQNDVPYTKYVEQSYIDNEIYSAFRANDYSLGMYTNSGFLSPDITLYENIEIGRYRISNKVSFAKKILKIISFNYMPHQAKRYFVYDTAELSSLKKATTDDPVYSEKTLKFKKNYLDKGIKITRQGNLLKLIHLDGVHTPYNFDENLIKNRSKDYTSYDEAAGCNELLKELFHDLMDHDIYDSSTIIIMADHGHVGYCQNPIFLFKNAYEKHKFQISEVPMSWDYFKTIWIALADGSIVDEDFINNCNPQKEERRFLFYRWDGAWNRKYMPGMEEMVCDGVAYDEDHLIPTGISFYANDEDHTYKLGETLDFVDGKSAYPYVPYGISYGNVSSEALMQFDIEDDFQNLRVDIKLSEECGTGTVEAYANDNAVAEILYSPSGTVSFVIPHDYVVEGKLNLKFVQDEDSGDAAFQETALSLYDITIVNTEEAFHSDHQ